MENIQTNAAKMHMEKLWVQALERARVGGSKVSGGIVTGTGKG